MVYVLWSKARKHTQSADKMESRTLHALSQSRTGVWLMAGGWNFARINREWSWPNLNEQELFTNDGEFRTRPDKQTCPESMCPTNAHWLTMMGKYYGRGLLEWDVPTALTVILVPVKTAVV